MNCQLPRVGFPPLRCGVSAGQDVDGAWCSGHFSGGGLVLKLGRRDHRLIHVLRTALAVLLGAAFLAGCDWYTYGFDLHRSGENPLENTIGVGNVSSLHRLWSRSLGGVIVGQPSVAAGVVINGTSYNVVYVGDEHGHFAAIDETSGSILWEHTLATVTITGCTDVAGGVFGIGGAALIDRGPTGSSSPRVTARCTRSISPPAPSVPVGPCTCSTPRR